MLSKLLQCRIIIVMQIKLTAVVVVVPLYRPTTGVELVDGVTTLIYFVVDGSVLEIIF